MIKVMFINNDGGGFADTIEIPTGTTVGALFARRMGSASPDSYLIRVNRQACNSQQVLQDGDRISITPKKIEGAH